MADNPYLNAPRLPEGTGVALGDLVPGPGPLELEVGPGRGAFLLERLVARADVRMIGLEIRRKWAQIVDERLEARGLGHRARVLAEDAREALPRVGPPGCLDVVYVHFPDPWWKKRHAKRLVVGDALLVEAARLLRAGGELYIQTDVEERAEQYQGEVLLVAAFEPAGDHPGSPLLEKNPYGARSNRERRADEDGLPVWRMRWRRKLGRQSAGGRRWVAGVGGPPAKARGRPSARPLSRPKALWAGRAPDSSGDSWPGSWVVWS